MNFKSFFVICIMILSFDSVGQVKFVNEFLNIGVGGRAHGMFGSVVATADDVTAAYWNPAGMSAIKSPLQISAMHANWFGGIANYDYVGVAKKFKSEKEAVGAITIVRMGIDNIPNTINLIGPDGTVNLDRISTFSANDLAVFLSYASRFRKDGPLSIGGSMKIIRRTIGDFGGAWGFGADIGLLWRSDNINFGISIKDITTTFNAWSFNLTESDKQVFEQTGNDIPVSSTEVALPRLILGLAYKGTKKSWAYCFEVDLNISSNGTESGIFSGKNVSVDPTFGGEIILLDKVAIRVGLGNIQKIVNPQNASFLEQKIDFQPNVGLGLKLGRVNVDYALTNVASISGALASHIFSLKLDFKARAKKSTSETESLGFLY